MRFGRTRVSGVRIRLGPPEPGGPPRVTATAWDALAPKFFDGLCFCLAPSGYEGNSGADAVQENPTKPAKIQQIDEFDLGRFGSCCTTFSHRKGIGSSFAFWITGISATFEPSKFHQAQVNQRVPGRMRFRKSIICEADSAATKRACWTVPS
jgi:hypothetical protein